MSWSHISAGISERIEINYQNTRTAVRQKVSEFGIWCVQCFSVTSSQLMLQQRHTVKLREVKGD